MPVNSMPVFIAKAPGRLCEGLCSLLENQPSIKLMGVIQNEADLVQSDGDSVFRILNRLAGRVAAERRVQLIIGGH